MERFENSGTIHKIPAPGLVELIESGRADSPETDALLARLFAPYENLDALVLGCTHYPFIARNIASIMGEQTRLLHGGLGTARETKRRLEKADLLRTGTGSVTILNSGADPRKLRLAQALLEGDPISFED